MPETPIDVNSSQATLAALNKIEQVVTYNIYAVLEDIRHQLVEQTQNVTASTNMASLANAIRTLDSTLQRWSSGLATNATLTSANITELKNLNASLQSSSSGVGGAASPQLLTTLNTLTQMLGPEFKSQLRKTDGFLDAAKKAIDKLADLTENERDSLKSAVERTMKREAPDDMFGASSGAKKAVMAMAGAAGGGLGGAVASMLLGGFEIGTIISVLKMGVDEWSKAAQQIQKTRETFTSVGGTQFSSMAGIDTFGFGLKLDSMVRNSTNGNMTLENISMILGEMKQLGLMNRMQVGPNGETVLDILNKYAESKTEQIKAGALNPSLIERALPYIVALPVLGPLGGIAGDVLNGKLDVRARKAQPYEQEQNNLIQSIATFGTGLSVMALAQGKTTNQILTDYNMTQRLGAGFGIGETMSGKGMEYKLSDPRFQKFMGVEAASAYFSKPRSEKDYGLDPTFVGSDLMTAWQTARTLGFSFDDLAAVVDKNREGLYNMTTSMQDAVGMIKQLYSPGFDQGPMMWLLMKDKIPLLNKLPDIVGMSAGALLANLTPETAKGKDFKRLVDEVKPYGVSTADLLVAAKQVQALLRSEPDFMMNKFFSGNQDMRAYMAFGGYQGILPNAWQVTSAQARMTEPLAIRYYLNRGMI
jgi:hypothetical protein